MEFTDQRNVLPQDAKVKTVDNLNIGYSLIKSVEFCLVHSGYYCTKCHHKKSTEKPSKNTICGNEIKTINEEKLKQEYIEEYGQEPTEEKMNDQSDILDMFILNGMELDDLDIYDINICNNTEFKYNKTDEILDKHDGEWLRIWNELEKPKENIGYSSLIGNNNDDINECDTDDSEDDTYDSEISIEINI